MKKEKKGQKKRNGEEWVMLARKFGENCVIIQKDSTLSESQKLEKQRALSKEVSKDIEGDAFLTAADKKQMIASINDYMKEWEMMARFSVEVHEKSGKITCN